jgi:hypothetical protein
MNDKIVYFIIAIYLIIINYYGIMKSKYSIIKNSLEELFNNFIFKLLYFGLIAYLFIMDKGESNFYLALLLVIVYVNTDIYIKKESINEDFSNYIQENFSLYQPPTVTNTKENAPVHQIITNMNEVSGFDPNQKILTIDQTEMLLPQPYRADEYMGGSQAEVMPNVNRYMASTDPTGPFTQSSVGYNEDN